VMEVSTDTIEIGNLKLIGFRSLTLLTTTLHPLVWFGFGTVGKKAVEQLFKHYLLWG
jgi:hypothetical protein